MIKENFTYEVEETVKVHKSTSVCDLYGESLACLEKKYLSPDQVFTDFRLPKTGELVLCDPGKASINTWVGRGLVGPRLIVGPKPKPRRIVFEEVRRDRCAKMGEFYEYSHINSSYPGIYYQAYSNYNFDQQVTIFRKLEDTGDSDPCQK
jgi:hypothetical protein